MLLMMMTNVNLVFMSDVRFMYRVVNFGKQHREYIAKMIV